MNAIVRIWFSPEEMSGRAAGETPPPSRVLRAHQLATAIKID
jgi:hypothetical protein